MLEILLLTIIFYLLHLNEWLQTGNLIIKLCAITPFLSMPVFPQLDARSRYQNYKMLRDQFYLYGFQPRIVKPFIKSRCQRDAAIVAASELGFEKICKEHFYSKGYRWYHLFPDFVFCNPRFLVCKNFWVTTFFAKKYIARIPDEIFYERKKKKTLSLIAASELA